MKIQQLFLVLFLAGTLLVGCDEPPEETNKKIDKTAESLKDIIDVLSDKSKEVVNDKELQNKLKDVIKDLSTEGKDIAEELNDIFEEKGGDWEKKIEKLKNNPEFKRKIEKLKREGEDNKDLVKEILEDMENEGIDVADELTGIFEGRSGDWEKKIEQLKNDPKFKEQLERLKGNGEEIKEILEDLEATLNKKKE